VGGGPEQVGPSFGSRPRSAPASVALTSLLTPLRDLALCDPSPNKERPATRKG
jgi:hypothetical protein